MASNYLLIVGGILVGKIICGYVSPTNAAAKTDVGDVR
jgi:hypothetical protein